jgi:hypothetical protein
MIEPNFGEEIIDRHVIVKTTYEGYHPAYEIRCGETKTTFQFSPDQQLAYCPLCGMELEP